jgi:CheY-like chemotaxis protein
MKTIIVADDSDLDGELTRRGLSKSVGDVAIILCADGVEALAAIETVAEIGLVILDHRMPRMGAEELLLQWTDRPVRLPIVLFSSAVSPSNIERCLELGVTEYVEKPTDPGEYDQVVRAMAARYLSP